MGGVNSSTNDHIKKQMGKFFTTFQTSLHIGNDFPNQEPFVGIENTSNICYANSVLQILYHIPKFRDNIINYRNNDNIKDVSHPIILLKEEFKKIQNIEKNPNVISTKAFMKYVRKSNSMFEGEMHQDCHEFFNWLLNEINDILNLKYQKDKKNPQYVPPKKTKSTWLEDIFGGQLVTQTKCYTCKQISERPEPFLDISLDIKCNCSLSACLKEMNKPEVLKGDDKFDCETCNQKMEAEKRTLLQTLPQTLIIYLKRFKYDEKQYGMVKLNWKIAFPLDFVANTNYQEEIEEKYDLQSVIQHHGLGIQYGHYTTFIKKTNDIWYHYDDELINMVNPYGLFSLFGTPENNSCAYMVVFQKRK